MRIDSGVANEVMAGVELHKSAPDGLAHFERALGFLSVLNMPNQQDRATWPVIGFGVSGWQEGSDNVEDEIHPITEYRDLPENVRELDRQGKGVGPRLYNTPQAVRGSAEDYERIGVYLFPFSLRRSSDQRKPYDNNTYGKLRRGLRHVALAAHWQLLGGEATTKLIHKNLGSVDLAIYNQTVDGEKKEKQRDAFGSSPIPEEFVVIRNRTIIPRKIGEYRRAD